MEWTQGYKIPFISTPTRNDCPAVYPKTDSELADFQAAINKLLEINAISKCDHDLDQFISSIFLVPKPNGEKRFILNLKCLNKFVKTQHFKMEDYRTASKLITYDCFMASIDIKDAYLLIPIYKPHRKYLRFIFNGIIFQFNCLPFGLCTSPYVFTKMLKPIMEYLRSRHFISCIYLDDILCIGKTRSECETNIMVTKSVLQYLGFIINREKSCFNPTKECKFLGFTFDSRRMGLRLPNSKKNKIKEKLLLFLRVRKCKLREFARLIGLLVSACPAIQFSWLYTKLLERHKYLCLLKYSSYEATITIPLELHDDLYWWIENIDTGFNPFRLNEFQIEIFSDASKSGWGGYSDGRKAYGFWKEDESSLHINELELRAAFLALKTFAEDIRNCEILLRIDNVTAISCINRMGSIQFPHLNHVTREIWQWCEKRKIVIFASYINTKENHEADKLSRSKFSDTEWELGDYAFREIIQTFGMPKVDLFASRCNAKCPVYITWKNDPDAWKVDAFTLSWKNIYFYAFPPFSLILKVIQKVIIDRAEGVLVVPNWPTQPWFPLFTKLTVSEAIYFKPNANLLTSPFRSTHNLHRTLSLVAAKLSGRRY